MQTTKALDPAALISAIRDLLPAAKQTLTSSHDTIAALTHAFLSAQSFRLTSSDESSSASPTSNNVLPSEWNENGPEYYSFNYRHEQSSLPFVVKIIKLGGRTVIISSESDKLSFLQFITDDYLSPSFFPYDADAADARPLVSAFVTSTRVQDLISQLELKINPKLIPGLCKERGYTDEQPTDVPATSRVNAPVASPSVDRLSSHRPPYDEDKNPLKIGESDLNPFMPRNPFGREGDGMIVGPDHPIFRGPDHPRFHGIRPQGQWGGDGFLPPIGAPPGARFDPVTPVPPRNPPFPPRNPPFPPRNPPFPPRNPDNDEFMPPGGSFM